MTLTPSSIRVGDTGDELDTTEVLGTVDGVPEQVVHREAVFIADPTDPNARAKVNQMPTGEYAARVEASFADSANMDGNSRLRVANPVNVFLNKNIHTDNETIWEEPMEGAIIEHGTVTGGPFQAAETITGGTSGATAVLTIVTASTVSYNINHNEFVDGETITGGTSGATAAVTTHNTGSDVYHDRDTASSTIQVGKVSGDNAVRQTHRYITYVPGKNQHITITFLFGEAVVGITRRVGSFNGDNGLFLEQTGTDVCVVRRTYTSGSAVNNRVEQADWNLDRLDGTGISGVTLDLSKVQFLVIDYVWQGAGRLRWGFEFEGKIVYFHEESFTNTLTVPFISTPSLPVKFEVLNTAGTASAHTMQEFCTSVVSEGGENLPGIGFVVSNDIVARTTGTTATPMLAIRLKNSYGGGANRVTAELSKVSFFVTGTGNAHWELRHLNAPSAITETWSDVSPASGVEFSADISAITGNPTHSIDEGYAAGGGGSQKGTAASEVSPDKQDQHRFLSQNFDSTNSQTFVLYGQAFTGTMSAYGLIGWIEYE